MSEDEARRLAEERWERRAAKDYAGADALRDRIRELGYAVKDTPDGFELTAAEPEAPGRIAPKDVPSALEEPATFEFSVHWVVQGWPEDAVRGIEAFRRHAGHRSVQHVVVDAAETNPSTWPEDAEVVALDRDHGWGADRNAGLRRSIGRIVVVVDGSVEPTGDVLTPLEEALADPTVGICGPFGIVTDDLREFRDAEGSECDAVEGYLMAFRREILHTAGFFDEKFTFYRTADIEYSFRVKDRGLRAVVVQVPVRRHEHRMWANTPEDERARLSKRNFYRFLERWRGRTDLTVRGTG
jgi:cysteinyl-tRNA synthetase